MSTTSISRKYLRPRWNEFLSQDKKGVMYIEGNSVKDLTAKYGTPLYVMIEEDIRKRFRRFKAAFKSYPKLRPQYATKCNSNLEILRIAREEGFELDVSSSGEIILGLLADFEPEQITFTNLYKTEQDIIFAVKVGVKAITSDSIEELQKMARVGERLGKRIPLFVRVNPLIKVGKTYSTYHHQYGIPYPSAKRALKFAMNSPYLELIGIHFHGSYIHDPSVYLIAAKKLMKLMRFCADHDVKIPYLDLGGGFPMEVESRKVGAKDLPKEYCGKGFFSPEDMGLEFVKQFKQELKKYRLPQPTLIFEPGKFIVATAGIGLVRIISKKRLKKDRVLVVNGSTYAFVPDPIIAHCYYDILPATKMTKKSRVVYNIAGCTCDALDIIGKNRMLPTLEAGDLLAIMDCGAYSNSVASNFNSLKRAPMVMVKENGAVRLIRRGDRYADMFAPELDVLKVAGPKEMKSFYNMMRINVNKLWGSNNGKVQHKK